MIFAWEYATMQRTVGRRASEKISAAPTEIRAGPAVVVWSESAGCPGRLYGRHAHVAVQKAPHSTERTFPARKSALYFPLQPKTGAGPYDVECLYRTRLLRLFIDDWNRTLSLRTLHGHGYEAESSRYCSPPHAPRSPISEADGAHHRGRLG